MARRQMSDSLSGVEAPADKVPFRPLTEVTYAEVNGAPPFDWNHFLNKARRSQAEWDDAYELSGKWVTCACGNQCAALPRDRYGVPSDFTLRELGINFCEAIRDKHRNTALEVLDAIEERASTLLAELPAAR